MGQATNHVSNKHHPSPTYKEHLDLPDGLVVEDPPGNAEDTGSIPSPRRFHPQLVKPVCPRARAPKQEKPPQ